MTKGKYPGWRTMRASERYNARMAQIWEDARAREREAAAQNVAGSPDTEAPAKDG